MGIQFARRQTLPLLVEEFLQHPKLVVVWLTSQATAELERDSFGIVHAVGIKRGRRQSAGALDKQRFIERRQCLDRRIGAGTANAGDVPVGSIEIL